MNKDLLELYKKVNLLPSNKEVEIIKNEIETALYNEMKDNILVVSSIGSVIGYDKVRNYLENTLRMIDLYDQDSDKD